MMVRARSQAGPLRANARDGIWLLLPYPLLVFSFVLAWVSGVPSGGAVAAMVGAALALAGWHWWWVLRHPQWLEVRLAPMVVYFVGFVGLTAYLCSLSFGFFPLYLVSFAMAFLALPGLWAYAGVALTAAVALVAPWLLVPSAENVVAIVGGGIVAGAAGWSIRALEAETAHRRAAMEELERTRVRLEQALAENLDLQSRLVAEARDSGIAAERTRIAAEFHDTVAAGLTGIVSQLEAVDALIEPDHPVRVRVQSSTEVARASLREARRSVAALRPGALTRRSLPAALIRVANEFGQSRGLSTTVMITGTPTDVAEEAEDALLRVAQEALTNTSRHARATRAHITLSYLDESVALDVADDGYGFATDAGRPGGHGLAIMHERMAAVGGRVQVASEPGTGTTLTVTLPLRNGERA